MTMVVTYFAICVTSLRIEPATMSKGLSRGWQ